MAHKSGKNFENLVAVIQRSVHKNFQIKPNDIVSDIDTNRARQIDISIRSSDGPTNFFGMVEVRDHNRPLDVRYIEEISCKKVSVGAHAAIVVSRSGFSKPALEKAKKLNIQTFTYAEAINSDRSVWLQCNSCVVYKRIYENICIGLINESDQFINLAPEVLTQVQTNCESKVLLGNDEKPLASLSNLIKICLNSFSDKIYEGLKANGKKERRPFLVALEPQVFVLGENGLKHKIVKALVEADFGVEERQYPFHLSSYRKTESDESIAEVATADVEIGGKKIRFDFIASVTDGYISGGSTVYLNTTPI